MVLGLRWSQVASARRKQGSSSMNRQSTNPALAPRHLCPQRMPPSLWSLPRLGCLVLSDVGLGRRPPPPGPAGALLTGVYPLPPDIGRLSHLTELGLLSHTCSSGELALLSAVSGAACTARAPPRPSPCSCRQAACARGCGRRRPPCTRVRRWRQCLLTCARPPWSLHLLSRS